MTLSIGTPAPLFTLATETGETFSLEAQRGKNVIVYFYPKDDTPGCTVEACAFRDNLPDFSGSNAVVVGISRDDVTSHAKFHQKFSLNFAADVTGEVTENYGVWVEKNMYGKKSMGIERATFLIDKDGNIAKIWRKVKAEGHAEAVLTALKQV
jgi:thioredoxin-dependent peroxiredoxin